MKGKKKPILIYGYGNQARQDDGLGPRLSEEIEKLKLPYVETTAGYQLNIEDAAEIGGRDLVIFIDTTVERTDGFTLKKVKPASGIAFTSHLIKPESVLSLLVLCKDASALREDASCSLFKGVAGRVPDAWVIGIRGHEFGYIESFSERALKNYKQALDFIKLLLHIYEGKIMATNSEIKTILIIDDDADIRASIRIVLESSGFSVGEAGDGEEGLKVAEKVKPDAVIVDLMMETVDAGSKMSTKLKESGFEGPIYLLSAVGDAVRYNIDAKELGLAGIFQKPINHELLVSTLKIKLKV